MSVPRVVVYDQDSSHRSACCEVLKSAGFEPVVVWDRERLVPSVDEDGVVAALVEPDSALGGSELFEALRGKGIPVFAMVSLWLGAMNRSVGVLYDGCADVMEKPVDGAELTRWLNRLFPDVKPIEPSAPSAAKPRRRTEEVTRETDPELANPVDVGVSPSVMRHSGAAPTAPTSSPVTGSNPPIRHQAHADPATAAMRTAEQGLVPPELDVRQVEQAGMFEKTYFPTLMAYLAFRRASGSLMLQRGNDKRLAYLEDGFVVGAKTNQPDDTLTESMVVQGLITPQQRMQVEAHSQAGRISITQGLVDLRIFPKADVDTILSAHLRNRLMDVFEWVDGTFTFKDGAVPQGYQHDPVVSPMDFIWQGVQFATPFSVVRDTLSPFTRHRLRWIGEPPPAGQMDMTQSQSAFLKDVERNLSLDDVRADGRLNEGVWRVAYVLAACGFIAFKTPG